MESFIDPEITGYSRLAGQQTLMIILTLYLPADGIASMPGFHLSSAAETVVFELKRQVLYY